MTITLLEQLITGIIFQEALQNPPYEFKIEHPQKGQETPDWPGYEFNEIIIKFVGDEPLWKKTIHVLETIKKQKQTYTLKYADGDFVFDSKTKKLQMINYSQYANHQAIKPNMLVMMALQKYIPQLYSQFNKGPRSSTLKNKIDQSIKLIADKLKSKTDQITFSNIEANVYRMGELIGLIKSDVLVNDSKFILKINLDADGVDLIYQIKVIPVDHIEWMDDKSFKILKPDNWDKKELSRYHNALSTKKLRFSFTEDPQQVLNKVLYKVIIAIKDVERTLHDMDLEYQTGNEQDMDHLP